MWIYPGGQGLGSCGHASGPAWSDERRTMAPSAGCDPSWDFLTGCTACQSPPTSPQQAMRRVTPKLLHVTGGERVRWSWDKCWSHARGEARASPPSDVKKPRSVWERPSWETRVNAPLYFPVAGAGSNFSSTTWGGVNDTEGFLRISTTATSSCGVGFLGRRPKKRSPT